MTFNSSKYSSWYFQIIQNATNQPRKKEMGYFESHHIVPKCLGGSNLVSNRVLLTAREHFICHLLLPKMVDDSNSKRKLVFAYLAMGQKNEHQASRITSKQYQKFRKLLGKKLTGREVTDSFRVKMSLNNGQGKGTKNSFYGKTHNEETKQRLREFAKKNLKGIAWITKDGKSKRVKPHELPSHLNDGWIRGRIRTW